MSEPKPVAIIAADTHIDEFIWTDRSEIRGDAYHGFSQLVDLAVKHSLPLIIAGDFLECLPVNYPTSRTIEFLHGRLRYLNDCGVEFRFINGQHDGSVSASTPWPVAIGFADSYRDFETETINGVEFTFMSYRPKKYLGDLLHELEESQVVICHQVWQELMGGRSCEGSLSRIPAKLVISGDYHQFKSVAVTRADGKGKLTAVSPGATHIRKINEPTEHFALKLYSDLSVKRIPLSSRRIMHVGVTGKDDLHDLLEYSDKLIRECKKYAKQHKLPPEISTAVLDVKDQSVISGVHAKLAQVYGNEMHIHYRRQAQTKLDSNFIDNVKFESAGIIVQALEYECKGRPELFGLLDECCKSNKPKALLDKLRKSFTE